MSDALLAVARNAIALLDDAEFLFENGRYPRAAALAILAAEEAGKFWLPKFKPEGWEGMLDRHAAKIGVGAKFHEAESVSDLILSSTGGMDEIFIGASSQPEYARRLERARAFLPLKEAGLYVDLDGEGKLTSDPSVAVGRDAAAKCLAYARSEVQRLYAAELVRGSLSP